MTAARKPVDSARRAAIAKIHVAAKALRLDDDTYRAVLEQVTGHTSCRALSLEQLDKVIAEFKRRGWREAGKFAAREKAPSHVRMIYALWKKAGELGVIEHSSKAALRAFVQRQTGASAPEFLRNAKEAQPVVEALKQMTERAGK